MEFLRASKSSFYFISFNIWLSAIYHVRDDFSLTDDNNTSYQEVETEMMDLSTPQEQLTDTEQYSYIMDIKIIDKKYYTFIEGFNECIEYHSIIELFNEIAEAYL